MDAGTLQLLLIVFPTLGIKKMDAEREYFRIFGVAADGQPCGCQQKLMNTSAKIICVLALTAGVLSTQAQFFVASWDFNSTVPDGNTGTGNWMPAQGSGSLSLLGGVSSTFVTGAGSSDPASTDNSALNISGWAPQGTESGLRGIEVQVPTVGYENLQVSWDHRFTATASRFVEFQYSTDGHNFVPWQTLENTSGANTWLNGWSVDLSDIAGVNDNSLFAFRLVSVFDPEIGTAYGPVGSSYGTSGTWRVDMVTVTGDMFSPVPEPEEYAIMAAGGLIAFGLYRRRCRMKAQAGVGTPLPQPGAE